MQSGGKIEIVDSQLPIGTPVEVIILLPKAVSVSRRSILDVLAAAPGQLAFQTATDVDNYLRAERDSW